MTGLASFLAINSIQTLAEIETKNYPIGTQILRDFYVNDLLMGANSIEEVRIRDKTTKLLTKGEFRLHK